jgi:hypothetical protein
MKKQKRCARKLFEDVESDVTMATHSDTKAIAVIDRGA